MKINYQLTKDGFKRTAEIVGKEYWPRTLLDRVMYTAMGLGASLIVWPAIDLFQMAPYLSPKLWWLMGGVTILALALAISLKSRYVDFSAMTEHLPIDTELSTHKNHLEANSMWTETKIARSAVLRVVEEEDGLGILLLGGDCIFLPNEAFTAQSTKDELCAWVEGKDAS